jgi:lipopolysaccharide/colanic/teichoic acid biosynthesis glycosyltransferase
MGSSPAPASRSADATPSELGTRLRRAADLLVGLVLLVLSAPLIAVIALAIRASSHGKVVHREPGRAPDGRAVHLLTFRTVVDGGRTEAHARLRAVIGGTAHAPFGRLLERTRLDHLPRLLNVVRGEASFFASSR